MVLYHRWAVFLTAGWSFLFLVSAPPAVTPEIKDDGKFFGAAAVKKADDRIREIYRQHQRDVLIETFAAAPAADLEKVRAMDAEKRKEYFLQWAKERAKERVVNGIYVLICKDPQHLLVGVQETPPQKFATGTRDAVESAFRKEFRESRFDEGLEQALNVVVDKLTKK